MPRDVAILKAKGAMRLYFAGPLFSEAERAFSLSLTHQLEALGFTVFLPQRDGVERDKPPYDAMPAGQKRRLLFETDRDEVLKAEVFPYALDGRVPDEGAPVELGIAYAHKHLTGARKVLVGLHTDVRASFLGAKLNPMLRAPLKHLVESEDALLSLLADLFTSKGQR